MNGVVKSFGSVMLVCVCYGSVINMDGVFKNCGSVIVFCEYNESVVDVYGNKLRRLRVVMERREKD
jgi:hypothetical protein